MSVSATLTVVLATLSSVITAYVAHLISLPHFHLLGGIPVGSVLIGTAAATGVAMAVRLTSNYDVAGFRMFAQLGGVTAYMGAMLLDYVAGEMRGHRAVAVPDALTVLNYVRVLVEQGAASITAQLPESIKFPPGVAVWLGVVRLFIEVLGTVVATGWAISYLTGVPFCWRNRRFYELKDVVESSNVGAVREWEMAINQRRPIEARALLARVRTGKVAPYERSWVRIAIHQCPICLAARVRIEKRRRAAFGRVRTSPADELQFDAVKGSALLAT